jgi:hypothetical protein
MTAAELQQLLDHVRDGLVAPADALEQVLGLMRAASFEDLGFARVDHHREFRQGFPEVVFGLGKTPEQLASISSRIVARGHTLLVTRASAEGFTAVQTAVPEAIFNATARTITYRQQDAQPGKGTILVAAAGTSDLPVAEEACITAEVMGNAALLVNPENVFEICKGLKHLLFDFNLRAELIARGLEQSRLYSWKKSAELVWQTYQKVAADR